MKPALIIFLLSILSITACSSNTSPKTQYYILNSPTSDVIKSGQNTKQSKKSANKAKPQLLVELLALPDYLSQPSLVLQLSDHQLHYSLFNMWAEPLKTGISQALANDLNSLNSSFNYIVKPQQTVNDIADISIKITSFQPTHLSQVILAGSYDIKLTNKESQTSSKHHTKQFTYTLSLIHI